MIDDGSVIELSLGIMLLLSLKLVCIVQACRHTPENIHGCQNRIYHGLRRVSFSKRSETSRDMRRPEPSLKHFEGCERIEKAYVLGSGVDLEDVGCSINRSSPLGFDSEWNCADRSVDVPSSQNSTSPSALSKPFLTRLPFSRIRSSMVIDLSEKILR